MIDKLIHEVENIPLEPKDVIAMIGKTVSVKYILYDNLKKYKSISDAFGNSKAILILLQLKGNGNGSVGHFVSLFRNKEGINYFDPYALGLAEDLHITHEPDYLIKLLKQQSYTENKNKYQSKKGDIATCGRHIAVRLKFYNLTDTEYHNLITGSKYSPDFIVSILTLFLTKHDGDDILKHTKLKLGGVIQYHDLHEYTYDNNDLMMPV